MLNLWNGNSQIQGKTKPMVILLQVKIKLILMICLEMIMEDVRLATMAKWRTWRSIMLSRGIDTKVYCLQRITIGIWENLIVEIVSKVVMDLVGKNEELNYPMSHIIEECKKIWKLLERLSNILSASKLLCGCSD